MPLHRRLQERSSRKTKPLPENLATTKGYWEHPQWKTRLRDWLRLKKQKPTKNNFSQIGKKQLK